MAIVERDFKIIIPITSQKNIKSVAKRMSKRFGGVTMHPLVRGYWVDAKGKLVFDDNILLFSSRDLQGVVKKKALLKKDRKFMENLAQSIGRKTRQEAIWIEEDLVKDIRFISPKKLRKVV